MPFPNEDSQFKPAVSGNPAGRPPGIPNTATRMRRWLDLETEEINPATGEKEKATILEKMDAAQIKKALKGDLAAYREILDRMEGKALQKNDITTDGESLNKRVDLSLLSDDDLRALSAIRRKLLGQGGGM